MRKRDLKAIIIEQAAHIDELRAALAKASTPDTRRKAPHPRDWVPRVKPVIITGTPCHDDRAEQDRIGYLNGEGYRAP